MNVRINIAENYKRTLANLDEAFSEWLAAASYIQTLTDIALPHIDSVVCAAMLPYAPPAVDLMAVGDEQEAAAWRALDEFCADSGFSRAAAVREATVNMLKDGKSVFFARVRVYEE